MRNQVLSDQATLLDAARNWAAAQPGAAPGATPGAVGGERPIIGRDSVSGDMEAIFGAEPHVEAAPAAAGRPTPAVEVVPVGGTRRAGAFRGRKAALAGGGLLLASVGAAAVTLFAFPELTPRTETIASSSAEPRTSLTTAPARPAPAAAEEELTPLTPLDSSYPELVISERTGAPLDPSFAAPAPQGAATPAVTPAPGTETQVAVAPQAAPAPVAARPVTTGTAQAGPSPAPAPRVSVPTRVASAPPAPARERAAPPATRTVSRAEPTRAPEPRRVANAPVSGATLMSGRIRNSDYPRDARRAGAEGTVHVQFGVQPNGRVGGCTVTRSSGSAVLDATTCRLIQRRFRYDPARDADGRAVGDTIIGRQVWWLDRRGRDDRGTSGEAGAVRPDPSGT